MRRFSTISGALVLILVSVGGQGTVAVGAVQTGSQHRVVDPAAVARGADMRAVFGLRSDAAFVADLMASERDAGSALYGMPLSADELRAVDLPGRSRAADHADKALRPIAMAEQGYAGMYQDQADGGRIVVRFTNVSAAGRARIARAAGSAPVAVTAGATYTYAQLDAAMGAAIARRAELFPGVAVRSVGIDEEGNLLHVTVDSSDLVRAAVFGDSASRSLGVTIELRPGGSIVDQGCGSRMTCFDPMRAGALVFRGGSNPVWCTMGFHVQLKSNTAVKGFATAGHCSTASWYMEGYAGASGTGFVGTTQKNLYGNGGKDFQVVALPSGQVSRKVYATTRNVAGSGNPVDGESIYLSPGWTGQSGSGWQKGTVFDAVTTWTPVTGLTVSGAEAQGFSTVIGDSGSPISRLSGTSAVIAVGIHDSSLNGTNHTYFARMGDALSSAGWSIH
jgi:hypothetical protein